MSTPITYAIKKNVSVVSTSSRGWTKELNLMSWNGNDAKYDIRDWDPQHEKMGKGITLTAEEAEVVAKAIIKDLKESKVSNPSVSEKKGAKK